MIKATFIGSSLFEERLQQLKNEENGSKLDKAQLDALSKMDEVKMHIAFVEDMQKLNLKQLSQYKK